MLINAKLIFIYLTILSHFNLNAVAASGQILPEAPAKQLIQSYCTSCHQLNRITS